METESDSYFPLQFLFLHIYVCLCVFFFLFGQYSECLHLFDISHLMPFFFKGGITLTVSRENVKSPQHNMYDKQIGAQALDIHRRFLSASREGTPSPVLYQRIYRSLGEAQQRSGESSAGGAVGSARRLRLETGVLAWIPDGI